MSAWRLTVSTLVGLALIVAMKVLVLSGWAWIWPPLIEVANLVVAALMVLALLTMFRSRFALIGDFLRDLEGLGPLLLRLAAREPSHLPRGRTTPRPSLSGWLVSAAVKRLPAAMGEQEKDRWEEEMRADVASVPRRSRLWIAFQIWRKGAPGMAAGDGYSLRSSDS